MLPYTGDLSAPTANHERAALLAAHLASETGGEQFELVFADSHSDTARGLAAAEALLEQGVVAIVGGESDELVEALVPRLDEAGVLLMLPGMTTSIADYEGDPWFRISPSTRAMGENLAKGTFARGVRAVSIVHSRGRFETAFAEAFAQRFAQSGGVVEETLAVDADQRSFGAEITALQGASTILLAAGPATAALLINEFSTTATPPRWLFPPTLRSEEFLVNVPEAALAGCLGVAPRVSVDPAFSDAFAARYSGDVPLDSALYYYDAVALVAMAHARAAASPSGASPEALADAVFAAAYPTGIETTWQYVGTAVQAISEGEARYYRGLTGPISFLSDGERNLGLHKLWTVSSAGTFVDEQ